MKSEVISRLICSQYSRQRNNKNSLNTIKGAFLMSKRMTKHTLNERVKAVLGVIEHKKSMNVIAKEYDVDYTTIESWVRKYQADGVDGLQEAKNWKRYSKELKRKAVESYLNGEGSQKVICEKFNISDPSVLRQWINLYTRGKETKSTDKRRKSMNKGRKTTQKEGVEIDQYTIANDIK